MFTYFPQKTSWSRSSQTRFPQVSHKFVKNGPYQNSTTICKPNLAYFTSILQEIDSKWLQKYFFPRLKVIWSTCLLLYLYITIYIHIFIYKIRQCTKLFKYQMTNDWRDWNSVKRKYFMYNVKNGQIKTLKEKPAYCWRIFEPESEKHWTRHWPEYAKNVASFFINLLLNQLHTYYM
jgi:predicted PurR-regulated permease PerM